MTITIQWWAIPALITLIVFVLGRNRFGRDYIGFVLSGIVASAAGIVAMIVALATWGITG